MRISLSSLPVTIQLPSCTSANAAYGAGSFQRGKLRAGGHVPYSGRIIDCGSQYSFSVRKEQGG